MKPRCATILPQCLRMPWRPIPSLLSGVWLNYVELSRLLCLSAMSRPWVETPPDAETVRQAMDTARETCARAALF